MADELEQAREALRGHNDDTTSEYFDADMTALEAAVRRDERLRCWREVQGTVNELCREDSPLSLRVGDFSGPGYEDVRWPLAVDRLIVPDEFLRPYGNRSRNDPRDW